MLLLPILATPWLRDGFQVLWGTRLTGGLNDGILAAAVDPMTGDVFATGYTAGNAPPLIGMPAYDTSSGLCTYARATAEVSELFI